MFRYLPEVRWNQVSNTTSDAKTMVELQESPYDSDFIPFAEASLVTFDDELSSDPVTEPAAESISALSSIGTSPVWDLPTEVDANTTPLTPTTNTRSPQQEQQQPQQQEERSVRKAAAAGGAVVGLFMGGPVVSLILGVGAHHYSKKEGATGDCARAVGEIALVTRDKFRQVNDRHHLVDKGKEAAVRTLNRMNREERKRKRRERLGYFVSHCYALTLDFVYRHRLIERGSEQVKKLLNMLTKVVRDHNRVTDTAQNQEHPSSDRSDDLSPSIVY